MGWHLPATNLSASVFWSVHQTITATGRVRKSGKWGPAGLGEGTGPEAGLSPVLAVGPGAELPHGRQVSVPGRAPSVAGEDAELWDMLLTGLKFMWGGCCGTAGYYLTLCPQLLD